MYSLGQDSSAEKLQKMMSAVDKDGDKKIDWEEFEAKLGNKVGAESANALQYARKCHSVEYLPLRRRASNEYASRGRAAFKIFDKDGNGLISAPELRHVMTNLGETLTNEEVDEMIRAHKRRSSRAAAH